MLKALVLLTASCLAQAETSSTPAVEEKLPFVTSLHWENDVLAKSDRLYTNGVRIEHFGEYDGCRALARTLGLPGGVQHRYLCGGSLAQNMYTPSRIVPLPDEAVFPDPNDRPYGGWLHGGFLFQHVFAGREPKDSSRLTLQATVGVTGPASGAAQTQRWLHRTINSLVGHTAARIPVGWEKQLPTEPAFHFSALREQPFLWSPVVDVTWSAGAMLGTVFVNASVGGTVRVGWLARPYGLAPIMPSVVRELESQRAPGEASAERVALRDERAWEAYLYARGQVRVVARNLFLDGTLFRPSISVRKAPIVGDSEFGAAFRTGGFQFGLGMVFRSQEMADPPNPLLSGHRFTQLQLSYLH
ncbi:Outer membrane protein assembly factor YaeT precursor [Myxococcus hansupus]|uniref:Outer membrane protein assembly factor YaeT n=1 Tax=Pseudomyxococcus hansupus TaxID=1297742 RepID=A0A0H4XDS8_9BACT|nr:lipid A deacylase LpxR family protein [Myxococcus hansupus]AKQ66207.1 Outer membrane protein assembly factor YaeT precursor [Myxococcus hansupus]